MFLHVCGNDYLLVCLFTQLLLTFVTFFKHSSALFPAVTSGEWLVYENYCSPTLQMAFARLCSDSSLVLTHLSPAFLFLNLF